MSKIDEVRADMVKAMKAGEKEKKDTLSLLLAALKNKAIDKRADLHSGRRELPGYHERDQTDKRNSGTDSC